MQENKKILKEIGSWLGVIVIAFFLYLIIDSTAIAKAQVEQSSMENTLYEGQQLVVNKLSYIFDEPDRGDIIIFFGDGEKGTFIEEFTKSFQRRFPIGNGEAKEKERLVKRVVGISGDEIDIKDGAIYINGEKLEEPYANGRTFPGKVELPIIIKENELFVIGDNREVSWDSRDFGPIDIKQVEGKAIYRIYPFDQMGIIK
ncbi:MAG: signal peptidase I [Clostridiales bacterium]|nr:signal peptidase I [Clostridiales bacterium]